MSRTVWRKGPPPSVGWWPASRAKQKRCTRWWNGKSWSPAAWEGFGVGAIRFVAKQAAMDQQGIEWTDRPDWWPARSRT